MFQKELLRKHGTPLILLGIAEVFECQGKVWKVLGRPSCLALVHQSSPECTLWPGQKVTMLLGINALKEEMKHANVFTILKTMISSVEFRVI